MQASWIDSDEVRALAAALQDPVVETHEEVWIPEPLLDDALIPDIAPSLSSYMASAPVVVPVSEPTIELQSLHDHLHRIREEARAAGLLPVVQDDPAPADAESSPIEEPVVQWEPPAADTPVITTPVTPEPCFTQQPELTEMSQRLRNFQQYAMALTACKDLLLMNQEGDLLWGNTQHYDIMATIMIAMRYHNPTAFEATHFKLTNLDDNLVVLSSPTRHGLVFLTLMNAENTDDHHLQTLNHAMIAAIEGTPGC